VSPDHDPAPPWVGYLFRHGRWQRACVGDNIGQCARRLTAAGRRLNVPDRCQALTTGRVPDWTPNQLPPVPAFDEAAAVPPPYNAVGTTPVRR
jgi:hypothetical protein